MLLFTCLYIVSYLILTHFKKTAEFVTGEFWNPSPPGMLGGELTARKAYLQRQRLGIVIVCLFMQLAGQNLKKASVVCKKVDEG